MHGAICRGVSDALEQPPPPPSQTPFTLLKRVCLQEPLLLHRCSFEGLQPATSSTSAHKAAGTIKGAMEHHLTRAALLAQCLQSAGEVAAWPGQDGGCQPRQRHVPLSQRATEPSMADRGMQVQEPAADAPERMMAAA